MRRRVFGIFLPVLLLCVSIQALAVPARPGIIKIQQPDGRFIEVIIRGDEYGHLMTTTDGCAVMRGSDGYCCYARFEADGSRVNTGVRVGTSADARVVAESRSIPYAALYKAAATRRQATGAAHMVRRAAPLTKSPHRYHVVVILAQFQDLRFKNSREAFERMVTAKGYSYNGATGSALDYFNDQFKGAAEFDFQVGPIVTLSKKYKYYGEDDSDGYDLHPIEAVTEACRLSSAQGVDFSGVDYVFMFFAGGNSADGGADDDHFWPHSCYFDDGGLVITPDGKSIKAYAMSSELMKTESGEMEFASIGTFCHEYSHILGLRDMYDTDYEKSGGRTRGLWRSTSIMDGGNYNNDGMTPPGYNSIELEMLGLLTPEKMDFGDYTLEPLNTGRRALRMDGDDPDEYFLFEARQALGWDKYIGGSGLLVYHVDRSGGQAGYSTICGRVLTAQERWIENEVNCNPSHQCADLVEAYSMADDAGQVFFPYSTINYLSPKSKSEFKFWNGGTPLMSLSKISKSNGTVSFVVNGPLVLDTRDVFQDAVILKWHTDLDDLAQLPSRVKWTSGGKTHDAVVEPYGDGMYSYTVEGLEAGSDYTFAISVGEGARAASTKVTVTTKPLGGQPFIYLTGASRNSAGKFTVCTRIPLRVYNLRNVRDVRWYWNGIGISAGEDGYFELVEDGILKAVVTYSDGSEEIFIKEISIR